MAGFAEFTDDRGAPGTRVWRRGKGGARFSGCVAIGFAFFAAGLGALTIFVLFVPEARWASIFLAVIAAYIGALVPYLWRDKQGKSGGLIVLTDEGVRLDLAKNRSLTHHSPAFAGTFAWPDLKSVEHRLEGYGAQGLAMVQRAYWLVPHAGEPVLLFEDRAIGSGQETECMMGLAEEIAARGGLPLIEHGMAQGKGGLFGAWFAKGPDLYAPDMPPRAQKRMWRHIWWTSAIVSLAWAIVMLAMIFGD